MRWAWAWHGLVATHCHCSARAVAHRCKNGRTSERLSRLSSAQKRLDARMSIQAQTLPHLVASWISLSSLRVRKALVKNAWG